MNWNNVRLIFCREVRDQLRDRRTLFMIAVLPLVLYPLLGLSFFQVAQFIEEHATQVLVLGVDQLPDSPGLVQRPEGKDRGKFLPRLFSQPRDARLLELHFADGAATGSSDGGPPSEAQAAQHARRAVQQGHYEAAIYFPPDFARGLATIRRMSGRNAGSTRDQATNTEQATGAGQAADDEQAAPRAASPHIYYNTSREASVITYARVSDVMRRWTEEIGRDNLAASGVPDAAARPVRMATDDVAAAKGGRGTAVWAKVLPFLMLVWALTGAFYPAIDLCAGEKERGTLETLLSSPAARSEIVMGKLLTIMLFSNATAVLNLVSMGLTGGLIMSRLPNFGGPPPSAPLWLLVALLPTSALFSAICLALAAFARSTREGQYYLMPVLLITMPLVVLPMSPGFELNLGNSLIPVTGVVLLLRSMLEGTSPQQVLPFVTPVAAVTLACCLLAIRWAIDQFNRESVLFRESERLQPALWFRHMVRDRQPTPTVAAAIGCGVLILVVRFFMGLALPQPGRFDELAVQALVTQLAVIATPALLMAVMFCTSPRQTLRLRRPSLAALAAALLLALSLHPAVNLLQAGVMRLYPISGELAEALAQLGQGPQNVWVFLLVLAVVPALCEELAFRGFILTGLERLGSKWRAIALSSLLFAAAHTIFQQSIIAGLVGLVIGYLAVQTGSLWPCVLFHMTHNSLAILSGRLTSEQVDRLPALAWIVRWSEDGLTYQPAAIAMGGLCALAILLWFHGRGAAPKPNGGERGRLEIGTSASGYSSYLG